MNFLQNILRKKEKRGTADITAISKEVGILLDTTSDNIFLEHRKALLEEDIVFIVYAVWGAKKDGELNTEQLAIHQKILPVISHAKQKIGLKEATAQQAYAVESLMRSVLINRITFMIAHFKDTVCQMSRPQTNSGNADTLSANDVDTWLDNLHVSENNPWWKRMKFDGGSFDDK